MPEDEQPADEAVAAAVAAARRDCGEKVRNLSAIYDQRYTAAVEDGDDAARTRYRQVRDDLAVLADNCGGTTDG